MSIKQWPGGVISDNPVVPAGNYQDSAAPGVWTLDRVAYWRAQDLWPTFGNINPSAYIENIFQTHLYTGNSSTQTITNGIDLAGEGGMVWIKDRTNAGNAHHLHDSERGVLKRLRSNATNAENTEANAITAFNSDGFSLGSEGSVNQSGDTFVSWTFRKQPKFFDIVTWSGDSTGARSIPHNLGSTPGFYTTKITNTVSNWHSWHRSLPSGYGILLNSTNPASTSTDIVDADASNINVTSSLNISGETYVAYIFAHEAGGFGDDGLQDVISCGNFAVSSSSDGVVNLGWEPQFVIIKQATVGGSGNWYMFDNMRGIVTGGNDYKVYANTTGAETFGSDIIDLSATGFTIKAGSVQGGTDYIYIAIRRGPMAVPTLGTSVFAPVTYTGTGATQTITSGFPVDLSINGNRGTATIGQFFFDRLRGATKALNSTDPTAEATDSTSLTSFASNTGVTLGTSASGWVNDSGRTYIDWTFKRAPGFMDMVAYTGTGVAGRTVAHNLGVAPELMIVKARNDAYFWVVYDATNGPTKQLLLNYPNASQAYSAGWNNTAPTASVFTTSYDAAAVERSTNRSTTNYIAYLFATLAGVSKVGSYTGTAADINVDCGFTTGARFVLIKRTDSTGDWYVWDSARGIVAGNDPYLLLNSTAAEVTSTDYIDSQSVGFTVTSTAPAALNASGGTYIFLAIA